VQNERIEEVHDGMPILQWLFMYDINHILSSELQSH
jgi:hypothetical protein